MDSSTTGIRRAQFAIAALVLTIVLQPNSHAADFFVTNISQLNTAVGNAVAGDTITMQDGNWTNNNVSFATDGDPNNPITLRAETPGQVILNGSSTLDISGDWLVVDGLRFEGGALSDGSNAIVEFRGSNGEATNSRFTNSAIIGYNPANINDRYHWVEMFGTNNRVDNNRFEDHNHSGVTVVVRRDDTGADNHLIDQNHFVDRPEGNGNGWETIRVGTSTESLSNSFTTVENNLFERVDGEIEIISSKSGENIYRYNTFRESKGTLTLRHGNDNLVEGNFFLGLGKDGSGGVRVIGERQTVVNNYIGAVDDRADGAISISAGVQGSAVNEYFQVKDAVIAHNTIVATSDAMITFDHGLGSSGRTLLAENVTIDNNLFFSNGSTIFEGTEGTGWSWAGNIAFGGSLGPKAGVPSGEINVVNPQMQFETSTGLWRLSSTSPAINASPVDYSSTISHDMDGQARIGVLDVGADEFSATTIVRKPFVAGDVGPGWFFDPNGGGDPNNGNGGGGGCIARGCAIQAEDYTSILDPDSNGLTWSTISDPNALGGQALQAPNGDRVELPQELHDTIAVYDLTFEQAGTYRAYYRAKGDGGSTDSIFVPDDFNVDPDNNESTSSNNKFRWEVGDTFTISAGNVGVPLEFRIGMREQNNVFDALVLDLDLSLSASELNALFDITIVEADFDEDGDVDHDDLLAWETGYGTSSAATHMDGDANGDGAVNGLDFLMWQEQYTGSSAPLSGLSQVPEPSSAVLVMLFALSLNVHIRNRKP